MEEALCSRCGHEESVHIESGPNGTPWCRLCYGHPQFHKQRDHAFNT